MLNALASTEAGLVTAETASAAPATISHMTAATGASLQHLFINGALVVGAAAFIIWAGRKVLQGIGALPASA